MTGSGAWATLPDGVRIHYRVQGEPGAPWLVLCNGLLSDTTMWAGALPGLTRAFRVLTFDGRGQGKTEAPCGEPFRVPRLAQDCWELLQHLGIERPWLAGLSNGSNLALELLADHPGAFRGGMLTSSVSHVDFSMGLQLSHWIRCLTLGGPGLQFEAVAPFLWGDAFLEKRYRTLKAYHEKGGGDNEPFDRFRHQIEGVIDWDIRQKLHQIQEPVLLMAGAQDLLTPVWKCEETSKFIANCQFEIVPGVGHAYPVEAPKAYAARVCSFART